MNRSFIPLMGLLVLSITFAQPSQAQESVVYHDDGCSVQNGCVGESSGGWATIHAWMFRRYAGSVEMETKTPYPESYFGRYTYRPWKPDWVRTASNRNRQAPYDAEIIARQQRTGLMTSPTMTPQSILSTGPPVEYQLSAPASSIMTQPLLQEVEIESYSPIR